jgi:hypothetical protein
MFDDCGIAFRRTKPPVVGEDRYNHLVGNWWRWWRSWRDAMPFDTEVNAMRDHKKSDRRSHESRLENSESDPRSLLSDARSLKSHREDS